MYRIDWLGPGHYRSNLFGVYGADGATDVTGRRKQLFRGTESECQTWVTLNVELARLLADQQWGQEHPFAGHCGDDDALADRIDALRAEIEQIGAAA